MHICRMKMLEQLAIQTGIANKQIEKVLELFDNGSTIPFIARYRKEMTGGLDEVQLETIQDARKHWVKLDERRKAMLDSLEERGLLTPELKNQLLQASTIQDAEDIYLPYRPKRRTKATIARENGLEALAKMIMSQGNDDPYRMAGRFLNAAIADEDSALQGARDIIAEWISDNAGARQTLRVQFERFAVLSSKVVKGKDEEGSKFRDYFSFSEQLSRMPSHRFMAVMRGQAEGILSIAALPEEEKAIEKLNRIFVKSRSEASQQVEKAVKDSYKRLIAPSLENEVITIIKEKADKQAVQIFAENLRQLLMGAPLGEKRVLGIDPGFRTGCKLVCLDDNGGLLHNETIYPHAPQMQDKQAMAKISQLVATYKIDAIAIGNGTAGRETEQLIQRMRFERPLQVFVVSESGASVYSASKIAREEFPQYDVTVRGAVSIGRRLQDPLAELVKIDPKSIGVGQYQHDVDQKLLEDRLTNVVLSCVNQVGVNLNTASAHLLTYISGLGPSLASNIVDYRNTHGPFSKRSDLKKVPRLGDKAFEQSAGFLRIDTSENPLDNSAVHPERYALVAQMAKDSGLSLKDIVGKKDLRQMIKPERYLTQDVGLPTLEDILSELEKPGRDPRKQAKVLVFDPSVRKPDDLIPGMVLPGIVTNITAFGAFVDVGVKQDGLVHVSQLADRFVSDPMEVVKLHQHVQVRVVEVDLARKRIAFSMKGINS
jgi:uncharacterized protein